MKVIIQESQLLEWIRKEVFIMDEKRKEQLMNELGLGVDVFIPSQPTFS